MRIRVTKSKTAANDTRKTIRLEWIVAGLAIVCSFIFSPAGHGLLAVAAHLLVGAASLSGLTLGGYVGAATGKRIGKTVASGKAMGPDEREITAGLWALGGLLLLSAVGAVLGFSLATALFHTTTVPWLAPRP